MSDSLSILNGVINYTNQNVSKLNIWIPNNKLTVWMIRVPSLVRILGKNLCKTSYRLF